MRWLAPVGAAGVVAVVASGVFSAGADPNLPVQTSAQLLAAIGNTTLAGYSGTVVEKASLGLPELPNLDTSSATSTSPLGLLTGSHTVRVWYAGQSKQRIALLDSLGEQDVFRNGRDLWQWNSDTRTATHTMLPTSMSATTQQLPTLTPDEAAKRALALIDPSTTVTTEHSATVAGRAAYVLVLTPKDARSKVGSVRVSVDGKTKVPLGVQVYPRNSAKAALDIAYTRFDPTVPDSDNFTWTPPAGVTVSHGTAGQSGHGRVAQAAGGTPPGVKTTGTGWTTILEASGVQSLNSSSSKLLLATLPTVKGTWGSGHLFTSALITGLITDDGRVFVGAVEPQLLYQAAAK